MPVLKIAVASVLALGLILGLALPGLADSDEPLPWADDFQFRIVKGTVTYVGEEYFEVQSGEDKLTISVDENTRYYKLGVPGRIVALAQHLKQFRLQNQEELGIGLQKQVRVRALAHNQMRLRLQNQISQLEDIPLEPQRIGAEWLRPFGAEAEFSDIEVGDRVVVWAEENSELLAKRVLIIKPTTYARVSGTITDISSSAIEITPDGGEAVTLDYNESTVFILSGFIAVEEGRYAHAIYDSQNMLARRVNVSLTSD